MRWTIVRPHWFMHNLLNEAGDVSARRSFSLNAGDGRLGVVDVRDVAELSARVLTEHTGRHDGRTYIPTGPQAVSFADVAHRFARVLGAKVDHVPVTDASKPRRRDEVRAAWEAHLRQAIDGNDGHLAYFYCFDAADPDVVCAFQQYRDERAARAFLETAAYRVYERRVTPLLVGPPEVRRLTPLWSTTAGALNPRPAGDRVAASTTVPREGRS